MSTKSQVLSVSFHTQRREDVKPPIDAECVTVCPRAALCTLRRAPERGKPQSTRRCGAVDADVVDADIVYADEDTTESVELKPKGVDDVDDGVVEVFFSGLSE
jgi:hypothetical protein